MSPADSPESQDQRIVVVLDASQESLAVLDAASWLAGTLLQRLEALFVEEEALTRAAGFPFAREISRIGAASRSLDRDAMARDLKAAAARARHAVAAAARRGSVPWQFDVVRGRYERAVIERATAGSLIAFGYRSGPVARRGIEALSRRASGSYLLVGPMATLRSGPVLVHVGGSASAVRVGALAAQIATAAGGPVIDVPDLGDILAAAGVPGAPGRAWTGAEDATRARPSLVVLTSEVRPPSLRLEDVLEHARCPVLVMAEPLPGTDAGAEDAEEAEE